MKSRNTDGERVKFWELCHFNIEWHFFRIKGNTVITLGWNYKLTKLRQSQANLTVIPVQYSWERSTKPCYHCKTSLTLSFGIFVYSIPLQFSGLFKCAFNVLSLIFVFMFVLVFSSASQVIQFYSMFEILVLLIWWYLDPLLDLEIRLSITSYSS